MKRIEGRFERRVIMSSRKHREAKKDVKHPAEGRGRAKPAARGSKRDALERLGRQFAKSVGGGLPDFELTWFTRSALPEH
jgi:hypothetical protein